MNNIEILEEKIKIIESLCIDDCINKSTVIQPLKYAIENLIQENKELRIEISARETVVDELEKENKELKERLKEAKEYIEKEMYVDDNPTICGDEEDTIIKLPISLNLYNEDLRKLLELLEGDN